MNYLEAGLPHTQFFPKKTFFSPPRSIPMSGLSRKYMGLEPVSRREIETIINRLSQPKKRPVEEDPIKVIREARPTVRGTGRFVGRKRMSSVQIERMVARLYSRRSAKDLVSEEELLDLDAVVPGPDDDLETADKDESVEAKQTEQIVTVEKQAERTVGERKNSILRKDSASGLRATMNVSFQDTEVQIDIPKLNLDIGAKRGDSKSKEFTTIIKQTSVQKVKDVKQTGDLKTVKQDSAKMPKYDGTKISTERRPELTRSHLSENFRPAKLDTMRPSTSDPHRSPKHMRREAPRPSTSDSPQSPRPSRQNLARLEEANKQKQDNRGSRFSTSTPCDELLIDRVASYNRSPRGRQDIKR